MVRVAQWLWLRSLALRRTLEEGRRHFECVKLGGVPFSMQCSPEGLELPRKLASRMWDTSISVATDQGSAGCRGGEALRVAIDQPMPGVRVVRVAGELDMLTAPQLDSCLLSQIDVRGGHVVVDLSKVTFLGAAGLGTLARAQEAATCHHIELHLAGVDHRAIARPLEITGLRPTFALHPSTESVIARIDGLVQLTDSDANQGIPAVCGR
jgi:anti-sigma B factor antagonist